MGIRGGVEFGVGGVDAFVHAELIEVGSVGWVELAGAVVDGVGVVVGDTFAAGVVVGALDDAGDGLRAGGVVGVGVGGALVGGEEFCAEAVAMDAVRSAAKERVVSFT